ncbi:S-DNA-T family DNA segregation ATPase FtsK/SpoIIIE [Clostridium punense]|uniref:S-DNA-T family DNA segregation ATPase FtsK/SpoIIIE n=2 Tax=Clostridium punense TaxID=1054297 RepID=A0ABS4JZ71_9CLOT|nr:S-DNA-T family DNA segregation ATPase FtsK/SpoIIIE [Clostridium punense]
MAKKSKDQDKKQEKSKKSRSSTAKINAGAEGKTEKNFDVTGIMLITLGVLILLSLFSSLFSNPSSLSGTIGIFLNKFFTGMLGLGAYIFPVFFIFIGLNYIATRGKLKFNQRFYGIILLVICTLLFIEMLVLPHYYKDGYLADAIIAQFNGDSTFHGGIIALLITVPLYQLFGKWGSYIIFIALYIIAVTLISEVTLKDLISKGKEYFAKEENQEKSEIKIGNEVAVEQVKESASVSQDFSTKLDPKIKIIDFMKSMESGEEPIETHEKPRSPKREVFEDQKHREVINTEIEEEIQINTSSSNIHYEYQYPSIDLLSKNEALNLKKGDKKELLNSANKLQETLLSFGVEAKVIQVTKGPSVTRFELQPNVGVKVSKIVNLSDDIALNLASSGVRIEAPIPGKAAVGIEVPNKDLTPVFLREVIEAEEFSKSNKNLAFCLGKDIGGNCIVSDLTKMPHLLIAGATGSGKSVCVNTLLMSLLYKYSPEDVKLLLIDPKVVELNIYNGIPHLLIPVVTDPKKAAGALNWAVNEMTRRYKVFADNNVRNIEGYNDLANKGIVEEKLPWIVIIIDELADLMMVCPNDIEDYIGRLAQMARAAGMHLVIATQRPSVDVITGVIKANIPSRISFSVSSQIDSRTILDSSGAEKLLGKGDMLFYPVGEAKPVRIQGAFVSEEEVERVVDFIKSGVEEIQYKKEIIDQIEVNANGKDEDGDELLDQAISIVLETGQASTSLLQRKLKIGYNRAARIMDQLEQNGVISGKNGSKPRQILIRENDYEGY